MAAAAITGDVGAGKSTCAKLLAEKFSCHLLDADKITADLWNDDNIKKIFAARWGKEIFDSSGKIVKSEISRRIFSASSQDEYKFCNSILHPLVMKKIMEQASKIKNLIVEIPLLFEATKCQEQKWIGKIIYVAANFETRARRCGEQRGWSIDELKRREAFLMSREQKISLSDFIIYNDNGLANLQEQLNKLGENFLNE